MYNTDELDELEVDFMEDVGAVLGVRAYVMPDGQMYIQVTSAMPIETITGLLHRVGESFIKTPATDFSSSLFLH